MINLFVMLSASLDQDLPNENNQNNQKIKKIPESDQQMDTLDSITSSNDSKKETTYLNGILKLACFFFFLFLIIKADLFIFHQINAFYTDKINFERKLSNFTNYNLDIQSEDETEDFQETQNQNEDRILITNSNLVLNNKPKFFHLNNVINAIKNKIVKSIKEVLSFCKFFKAYLLFTFLSFLIIFQLQYNFPYFKYVLKLFLCVIIIGGVISGISFLIFIRIKKYPKTLTKILLELNEDKTRFDDWYLFKRLVTETTNGNISFVLFMLIVIYFSLYICEKENTELINFNFTLENQKNILIRAVLATICFISCTFLLYKSQLSLAIQEKLLTILFFIFIM